MIQIYFYIQSIKLNRELKILVFLGLTIILSLSIIPLAVESCGCGGIGIRARLRGVWFLPYEFKSRHPHQNAESLWFGDFFKGGVLFVQH